MKSITWDYPNPHLLPLTVDDQHLDAMRHTNNEFFNTCFTAARNNFCQHGN